MKAAMEKLSKKGLKLTQRHMMVAVHHAISQTVQQAASTKIGLSVAHGASVAAGSTAGSFLAKILFQVIAHHINYIIAHAMSNVAVKVAVKAVAKKVCLVTVTGVVVQTLAAKLGISSAAAAFHVIGAAVLGGYLTIKLIDLPEDMARKVSHGVRDTLNDNYQPCLEKIFADLTRATLDPEKLCNMFVSEMLNTDGWQKELEQGVDFSNPDLPQLEKDVRKQAGRLYELMEKKKR
jgi:hypothetical protein